MLRRIVHGVLLAVGVVVFVVVMLTLAAVLRQGRD